MSLTDDTNTQTIDIPLPQESNISSNCDSTQQQMTTTSVDSTISDKTLDSNEEKFIKNESIDNSLEQQQQCYQSYYNYYSAYNIPPVMPQTYPYFVPVVQPLVPVMPSIQPSIQQQKQSIVSSVNSKGDHNNDNYEEEEEDTDSDPTVAKARPSKASNVLPIHCNDKMGLNPLIYTNIQQSPYFKNNLFQLKTYHEVIDEIYYSVKHLEPWEKGSRKIGGQTGMCGSVRGVGAGGIISTPFCILFKLFTLKLTRKQVNGMIRHKDSPYIRALGFMYIRFTQPPQHLWQWFEPFLDDEEEVDPKAGGGQPITIGQMSRHMLTKLDWFSTLFPRVPVPIQKDIESKLKKRDAEIEEQMRAERGIEDGEVEDDEEDDNRDRRSGARFRHDRRQSNSRERRRSRDKKRSRSRSLSRRSRSKDDKSSRSNDKHRYRRSRSPHSPHSHRNSRGDNREREHHRHRHRY